ncbi:MAG: chromate transporter [bacterium]|nr:chromate transporter [bacterium]
MNSKIPTLRQLFIVFLKIGILSVGGGYAMLAVMERELVTRKQWITHDEFLDACTVGQSSPGVMITNIGAFIAYRLHGIPGLLTAIAGLVTPAFLIVLLLASVYYHTANLENIRAMLTGVAPAVVGMFLGMTFRLARTCIKKIEQGIICGIVFIAVAVFHLHPILVLIVVGVYALFRTYAVRSK